MEKTRENLPEVNELETVYLSDIDAEIGMKLEAIQIMHLSSLESITSGNVEDIDINLLMTMSLMINDQLKELRQFIKEYNK